MQFWCSEGYKGVMLQTVVSVGKTWVKCSVRSHCGSAARTRGNSLHAQMFPGTIKEAEGDATSVADPMLLAGFDRTRTRVKDGGETGGGGVRRGGVGGVQAFPAITGQRWVHPEQFSSPS